MEGSIHYIDDEDHDENDVITSSMNDKAPPQ